MPARMGKIMRAAKKLGVQVVKPTRGSHWKFTMDGRMYPVPAGNGEKQEIDDKYIRGLCRAFGLDFDAFVKSL